jgi:hypothetical protein
MSESPNECDETESGSGRAHGRDDPLERLRQFERERGLSEEPVTPEESEEPEEEDTESDPS